jgi:hypothetical protein
MSIINVEKECGQFHVLTIGMKHESSITVYKKSGTTESGCPNLSIAKCYNSEV